MLETLLPELVGVCYSEMRVIMFKQSSLRLGVKGQQLPHKSRPGHVV